MKSNQQHLVQIPQTVMDEGMNDIRTRMDARSARVEYSSGLHTIRKTRLQTRTLAEEDQTTPASFSPGTAPQDAMPSHASQ
jgi:hypothetical protein